MAEWIQNPNVQSSIIPFLLGLLIALALRHFGGEKAGARLAPAAIGLGLVLMIGWIMGIEGFPPAQTRGKLFYLAVIGVAVPWGLGLAGTDQRWRRAWAAVFPVLSILWLGQRLLANALSATLVIEMVALLAGSWIVLWGLARADDWPVGAGGEGEAARAPILLMIVGLALSIILIIGGGARAAQVSAATAALCGAYILIAYIDQARGWTTAAMGVNRLAAAGPWIAVAQFAVLLGTDVSRLALLVLLLTFAMHPLARRAVAGSRLTGRLLTPILYGAISAIPAVIAVIWALYLSGGSGPYGGY